MQIRLENIKENAVSFMRSCGYAFLRAEAEEMSFARRLAGRDYPRFHVYTRADNKVLVVNLHLDQKKPSYEGASAHSGEYDGDVVADEAERIKSFADSYTEPERITEF